MKCTVSSLRDKSLLVSCASDPLVYLLQELDFFIYSFLGSKLQSPTIHNEQIWWWWYQPLLTVQHVELVFVAVITGTVLINNWTQSMCILSYSTLWAIFISWPIHSASTPEWITLWTDPIFSPPPPFIFLPLTFIEAFQRISPLVIHFLKWNYREKAHGLCVRVYVCLVFIILLCYCFHGACVFIRWPSLPLSPLPSLSLTGQLYSFVNQYSNVVCKNCHTSRPDVSLYSFIYEKVSSPTPTNVPDSPKDSGTSPSMSDSH